MLFTDDISATHLVGSDMYYEDLGGGNYNIILKVYRECGPANTNGTGFDDIIYFGVFNSATNQLIDEYDVFLNAITIQDVPIIMTNPCGIPPTDLCIDEATFTQQMYLPDGPDGYTVVWQRCCRNPTISNLNTIGGNQPGMTSTVTIPGTNQINQVNNSSPVWEEFPPVAICANFEFFFDHGAIDSDGDELVYSFCAPFHGADGNDPAPNPPNNPPYIPVPYAPGFSANYPIASDPAFAIDPVTGLITGTPTTPGQYAMGICCEEYRDGVYLGRILRDFQFNVVLCDANIVSSVTPQQPEQLCIGETLTFENNSINAEDYIWDFGVDGIETDISTEFEPQFTFPDTGTYIVTLIANPTWPCSDTSSQIFDVFEPLEPEILIDDFDCVNNTEIFDFEATGNLNTEATYFWDFNGGQPANGNIQNPQNINFSNADIWSVDLTVNNHGCVAETSFDYTAPLEPIASIEDQTGFCEGLTFTFENNSSNSETYLWDFGSPWGDDSSTDFEPSYTYADSGSYIVTLTAYAPFTCPHSTTATVDIYYLLEPQFQAPDPDCYSSHNFSMTGTASIDSNTEYSWDFGGNITSANTNGPNVSNLVYSEPGIYDVTLTAEVPGLDGCLQSYTEQVEAIADPTVNFSAGPLEGCPPHQVSFTNQSTTNTTTTYLWNFGDGSTSNSVHAVHQYLNTGSFNVTLEMTTGGFCVQELALLQENLVNTYPVPIAAFDVDPNQVDILTPLVNITNLGDEEVDCYYNFGDGGSMQDCNGQYLYSDGGNYTITQTLINEFGCVNNASGEVSISGSVFYAPTSFTPNSDGINDYWMPVILGANSYRLRIFNRWGELIWETLDSETPWLGEKGLDGNHFCPDGLYVWEVVWVDQIGYPRSKTGRVFLTR